MKSQPHKKKATYPSKVARSGWALLYALVVKIWVRLGRLLVHLWNGMKGFAVHTWDGIKTLFSKPSKLGTWLFVGLVGLGAWIGRLITKALDVIGLAEGADFLGQIFKHNTRGLSPIEIEEAKKVFGKAVPYEKVRIDEKSLLARMGMWLQKSKGLGVVVGYTIHFNRDIHPEPGNHHMRWLIHELTHVAQLESLGLQYIPESLVAQAGAGYDYGGADGLIGKKLADFNREQQGDICADYYRRVLFDCADGKEYERLMEEVRAGKF